MSEEEVRREGGGKEWDGGRENKKEREEVERCRSWNETFCSSQYTLESRTPLCTSKMPLRWTYLL